MNKDEQLDSVDDSSIAIVGMAGRFPRANNIEELWQNLRDGVESIRFFSQEELQAEGISAAVYNQPNYVPARAVLEDVDLFDAPFFGISPREAELMDPQFRVFMENAWEALENAGYDPESFNRPIGVFAGATTNTYILNLMLNSNLAGLVDGFQVKIANDKDHLPTRVSYKLNLRGPSMNVQTACSTSLVAVHLAYQSLLAGECDMALAGGVSINLPQKGGHVYQDGAIGSPDGHCRAFDAGARGCVLGSGSGIVVLKRLADALADGDCIHAVIRGSAINNDGSQKPGYTAPSIEGQAEVISDALAIAAIEPDTIGYVEAHGTGTPIGDPIEIAALTQAFRKGTQKKNFCGVGSIKTNMGHLDTAAGVAGLIKTVLAVKHKMIPPSLHFKKPNPRIDFEKSPFYVSAALKEWPEGQTPRRAAVSSFGIGGTNAHAIIEEAPAVEPTGCGRSYHLITLSARTVTALDKATARLAGRLKATEGDVSLADVAYTLQVGRKAFEHRRAVVCRDARDFIEASQAQDQKRVITAEEVPNRPVVFMFSGQGAAYVNMGRDLYREFPAFREQFDKCSELLERESGLDLKRLVYPEPQHADDAREALNHGAALQPALFAIEYALAHLWMGWGINPKAMIGHSFGEYVAACLSGVFSLKEAISLASLRGKLTDELPEGSMLSVPSPEEELAPLLSESCSLACVNGPAQCIISGPVEAIEEMAELLSRRNVQVRALPLNRAFHSEMVRPMTDEFEKFMATLDLKPPSIPYISNVTGTWVTPAQATDPKYWVRHLRETVRFSDGVKELLKDKTCALVEVGPGRTLSSLVKSHAALSQGRVVVSSVGHQMDEQSDSAFLLNTLGRLWSAGVKVDWAGFYSRERRRRVELPTYPFERQRYWVDARWRTGNDKPNQAAARQRKADVADWFYIPSWKRSMPRSLAAHEKLLDRAAGWLIFVDQSGLCEELVRRLKQAGQSPVLVKPGRQFGRDERGAYTLDPRSPEDYLALVRDLKAANAVPLRVVHAWSITRGHPELDGVSFFEQCQDLGYYSLLYLAQAIEKHAITSPIQISVVSNGAVALTNDEPLYPEKATALGPCKVIPQEYEYVSCRYIDVGISAGGAQGGARLIDHLLAEFLSFPPDKVILYRGGQRWSQTYENVRLDGGDAEARPLKRGGVYVIVGGLGQVGLLLAHFLAQNYGAKLALIGRTGLPPADTWDQWLASHEESDVTCRRIRKVRELESLGTELVILNADAADIKQMGPAIDEVYKRFGLIDGLIYGAFNYSTDKSTVSHFGRIGRDESERMFRPTVYGLYVLEEVLKGRELDWCLLLSSTASVTGGIGYVSYAAANLFRDAYAASHNRTRRAAWISSDWDGWLLRDIPNRVINTNSNMDLHAMTPAESTEAFKRVVTMALADQVVISATDLQARLGQLARAESHGSKGKAAASGPAEKAEQQPSAPSNSNGNQARTFVAPRNELEQAIAEIWQQVLGLERVGIHDDFFDLGGDSLLATRVFARLRDTFEMSLPLRTIFETPTVAQLVELIEQTIVAEVSALPESEAEQLLSNEATSSREK